MLGRGIGLNAVVVAVAAVVGPTLASAILAVGSWPWLFAINVPVGALAIAVAARALPRSTGKGVAAVEASAGAAMAKRATGRTVRARRRSKGLTGSVSPWEIDCSLWPERLTVLRPGRKAAALTL